MKQLRIRKVGKHSKRSFTEWREYINHNYQMTKIRKHLKPHADNIAPCISGGLVLIRDTKSLDIINIPIDELFFAIIHPDVKGNNKKAENKLKEINESYKILLKKFVK